jgi:hypothetical protein
VHGTANSGIQAVTIYIYDPNVPNDDDVRLTFYTGCDDSWIGMRHNRGASARGFFLDDRNRTFAHPASTTLTIASCTQSGISSPSRADYQFTFSWTCSFIPYFCIQVNGTNWNYNGVARSGLEPISMDDKQCPTTTGSTTVSLSLPRARSQITVRLLNSDLFSQTVEVDATPSIVCLPYARIRGAGDEPQIVDPGITDADLFIKDPAPSQATLDQVDTSPFRWITVASRHAGSTPPSGSPFSRPNIVVITENLLGNIVVPVFGNFLESNLSPPTQTSGTVSIFRSGQPVQTTAISPLANQGQKIFAGFTNNPADYDGDTRVEFSYESKDRFGVIARGRSTFFGKSIIQRHTVTTMYVVDPGKIARFDAAARYLIQLGLIDVAIGLKQGRGPLPAPPGPDRVALITRLNAHRDLPGLIDATTKKLWSDSTTWQRAWNEQEQALKQPDEQLPAWTDTSLTAGKRLQLTGQMSGDKQRAFDSIVINSVVDLALGRLLKDPAVITKLKGL